MNYSKYKQIAYISVIIFLGFSLFGNFKLYFKAQKSLQNAQSELESASMANEDLHKKLISIGKISYVERVARDTLGLARQGEVVFVLPSEEEEELRKLSPRLIAQNTQSKPPPIPHWQEWLKLFL